MKKLQRLVVILALPLLFAACASKSGFEPYTATEKETKDLAAKTYQLTKVSLELGGNLATSQYPDKDVLEQAFADEIRAVLKQRSLEGTRYGLRVDVKWERRMVGGSSTEAKDVFSSAGCTFMSVIHDEKGDAVATDAGDPLNSSSMASDQRNILNNLIRIKDSLTRTGSPESEMRELKRCAMMLVERLPS
jgi:hypothetical protein